ncbi:cannabinoid receptor 2 [Rhinatrema bivittatum]|uniref:cannabinoid receptor 2 n=1 Tax=Rhinatrema bivittatum TaxID=194408 RepID=UPI00112D51E6|nr:cannabinoid receptor 2 [Rhinatrema bivittatum]XP_029426940.1 cannabinoid receptor 2 [Rhinatrema bivittatum]XP_029426941.1 cannabinoid receptor 2 [Rhinatrema bivittatum]XP_029426942.1 cannabinoid receptor 2 [Rhinatrema bivittatum]XP_029426943.1 cannabinoid receptor 2 [Rhinatrema bivittatum]XP_029426944.1 cannabinoid receptor 2 [Rhinatrema bivittatum]
MNQTQENTTKCEMHITDIGSYMVLDLSQEIAVAVLCFAMGFFCILENVLVFYLIFSSRHLRKRPSYLFISNVALADLLASVIFVYSFVDFHVFKGRTSPSIFLFKLGGVTASFTASLGSLLLTAFDRYICIYRPLAYKTIVTQQRALLALAVLWMTTLITAYLPLMGWNCCKLNSACSELFPLIDNGYLSSWICLVMILLLAIVYAYVYIFWKARRHHQYMNNYQLQSGQAQDKMRMDIMLAKTLVLVLTVLVTCWSPVLLIMIYSLFTELNDDVKKVFAFCSTLCLVNSMVNPIIYALRSKEMRRRLINGLFWCRKMLRIPGKNQGAENSQNAMVDTVGEDTKQDTDRHTEGNFQKDLPA